MKTPAALQPLIDDGVIDEVTRSLKSGKEATVYLVRSGVQTWRSAFSRSAPATDLPAFFVPKHLWRWLGQGRLLIVAA